MEARFIILQLPLGTPSAIISIFGPLTDTVNWYAAEGQQAVSAAAAPTLYSTLSAMEKLSASWGKVSNKANYAKFEPAMA